GLPVQSACSECVQTGRVAAISRTLSKGVGIFTPEQVLMAEVFESTATATATITATVRGPRTLMLPYLHSNSSLSDRANG
ncbi:hypothetical protein J6590_097303, partial [Homalodisca vitripennis]